MTKEAFIKGTNLATNIVEINKGNIIEKATKRVTNLSKNEKTYSQGDGIIKIAPFDNYYLFTIYSELNLEDVPVDLRNMGSFYLTFKDTESEVRIQNYTNTKDIDPSAGQILFKISQENAEKALSLNTNVFYITSMASDDKSKSDETVLYSGKFVEYNAGNINSLTDTINRLKTEKQELTNSTSAQINNLQKKVNELTDALTKLKNEYLAVKEDLDSYKNLYNEVCKKLSISVQVKEKSNSSVIDEINNTAIQSAATKEAEKTKRLSDYKNAVKMYQKPFIGISLEVPNYSSKDISNSKNTEQNTLMKVANVSIPQGTIMIYEFMYTTSGELDTEDERTAYNNLSNLYDRIKQNINNNKNQNNKILVTSVYRDSDLGNLISKYNVNKNCIIVTKDNITLGTIPVSFESATNTNISTEIINTIVGIIERNN